VSDGSPSLVANLWDVTDRDIDRLSEDVMKRWKLEANRVPSGSASASMASSTTPSASSRSKSKGRSGSSSTASQGGAGAIGNLTSAMCSIRLDTDEGISNVQAVNRARDECKLTYLTGAAPVVYGLPIYT
jgi:separase